MVLLLDLILLSFFFAPKARMILNLDSCSHGGFPAVNQFAFLS